MATVIADMSMTLDGFVAYPADRVDHVFAWTGKGQETVTTHGDTNDFQVDPSSAKELREAIAGGVGALVCGRRLFDNRPRLERTAPGRGSRLVGIASPTIAQQRLNAGLLDAIRISLVPVLLGEGIRFFDNLQTVPIMLDDHPRVTQGVGVTHLHYRIEKNSPA